MKARNRYLNGFGPYFLKMGDSLTPGAGQSANFVIQTTLNVMTQRMQENLLKAFFFLVMFMVLMLQSLFTLAQSAWSE